MSPPIPQRILLGPGPSEVPARVLAALARPTLGHLDPIFLELMDGVREKLRGIFRTQNAMTMAISGTGTAGMETVLVNLLEPGDRAMVAVNGYFGARMAEIAGRCGAEVAVLEAPWGEVFEQDAIIAGIDRHRPQVVAVVHAETSTGAWQPVDRLAEAAHERGALLVLDCVTSLAGLPLEIDAWGVDAAYAASQKCLSAPPGLSPVTLSARAVERLEKRRRKVQSWYLDLTLLSGYWGQGPGQARAYHHTAPINMLYALDEALDMVIEEGLPARFARHRENHERLKSGLAKLGIGYLTQEGHALPMLNAVSVPGGSDEAVLRRRLLEEYGIEVGGGLGAFTGRAIRIGLMGYASSRRNVALILAALADVLGR